MVCFWESFQNLFFFVCVKSLGLDESRCRTVTQENSDPTVLRAAFLLLLLLHMKSVCAWVRLHSRNCIILYLESLRHSYEAVFVLGWGNATNWVFHGCVCGFVLVCKLTTAYNCDCNVVLTVQSNEFGKCKCTHFIHSVFELLCKKYWYSSQ